MPFARVVIAVDEDCRKHPEGMRGRQGREHGDGLDRESFLLRCDAAGHFETDEVPEGDTLVMARGSVDGPSGVAITTMTVSAWSANRCDLVLRPGPELFGTVRDEAGQPFAGLPILAEWRGSKDLGQFEGGLGHLVGSVTAVTAADGSYRLWGLLPGEHRVQLGARLDDQLRIEDPLGQRETVTLLGAEAQQRDFVVARRADLPLRLLGPNDEPLADWAVWVDVHDRANIRFGDLERQRTGADGRIVLPHQARAVGLHVTAYAPRPPGSGDDRVDRFPAGRWSAIEATGEEVSLRVDADHLPTATLRGRIVDRRGIPVGAPIAQLCRLDWHEARRIVIAEDGVFAFVGLPAGSYFLRRLPGGDPHPGPFDLAPGQQLDLGDLVLPDPGTLRVRLVCTDGAPIRDGEATLVRPDGLDGPWSPRKEGDTLVWQRRAPGNYRLFVSGGDLGPGVHDVEIADGEDRTIQLRCERGFEQEFAVRLPRGAPPPIPVGGTNEVCEYAIHAPDGPQVHRGRSSTLHFTLPMAPGSWLVRVEVPGHERVYHTVELEAGGTGRPIVVPVQ
ncbi:MAG: carboxypeptidase regulatory-like domain-containing protein [Planctomycetes bacterium]|nr:carboxypeptidase regulatory-like domain-containing protein [Planctomycetota bacterium]